MKKAFIVILSLLLFATTAVADVPDVSSLQLEELIDLQKTVNELIAENYTYTMLPGIYDCENDFRWNWYVCKVLPGPNGEERTSTITFHNFTPRNEPFLTYEGIKLSLIKDGSSAQLFMVIQGAALEAVPYSGF